MEISDVFFRKIRYDNVSEKIGLRKFNEIINGTRPFTYEMVLRSNISYTVDAAYHLDIIISKGNTCATLRYGGTTIGFLYLQQRWQLERYAVQYLV